MVARRRVLLALGATALAAARAPSAQVQGARIPRIDYLSQGSEADRGVFLGAFREGLRELGWIDGKNVLIDVHWAPANDFPQLAASLVKRDPAAIVGTCIPSTRAAKNATTTIPVVMSVNGDPVESGLVASLARPGANVTGTSTLFEELIPKWFEIISTTIPGIRNVAVMANPEGVGDEYWWARAQQAAERLHLNVVRSEVHTAAGFGPEFASMKKRRLDAFILMVDAYFLNEMQRIVTLASEYKLPAVYGFREYVEAGGLISYGLSYRDYYKGVARYVDKVLRGAKPADLPVEQPAKIQLVINLGTARAIGLAIPASVLARADDVIR
ncbi:MAG: ABC transporter substrate-binding protein [Burkholderiales bacterium]